MNSERYLTVAEFASRTRLSERTVRHLIASGRLPVARPSGVRAIRIPDSAVARFMAGEPMAHASGD
jgi:excisionase family DNA binding protein